MDLITKPEPKHEVERLSLNTPQPKAKPMEYVAEKKDLPQGIKAFDKKVKTYKESPYSYNFHSLAKKDVVYTPQAGEMLTTPVYNKVGKTLGVDTVHDWNKYYDKIYQVVEIAKKHVGEDTDKIVSWLYKHMQHAPTISPRNIDNLHIYLQMGKFTEQKPKTRVVTKTVTRYIKQKPTQEEMANAFLQSLKY